MRAYLGLERMSSTADGKVYASADDVARIIVEEDGDGRAWDETAPDRREFEFGAAFAAADRIARLFS